MRWQLAKSYSTLLCFVLFTMPIGGVSNIHNDCN